MYAYGGNTRRMVEVKGAVDKGLKSVGRCRTRKQADDVLLPIALQVEKCCDVMPDVSSWDQTMWWGRR